LEGAVPPCSLILFCAAAVYTDIRSGRIPNSLNGIGFTCGLLISCLRGGTGGLAGSLAGSLLGLSILLVPFLLHMVGGGDAKFFAGAGAIVGWRVLWLSFLAGAAIGGVIGAALLMTRGGSLARLRQRLFLMRAGTRRTPGALIRPAGPGLRDIRMPYAVPLSLGLITIACINLFR
jgi:prepilin peptidase CpaA